MIVGGEVVGGEVVVGEVVGGVDVVGADQAIIPLVILANITLYRGIY